jgi:uncharacterized protein (DUF1330 family)
MNTKFKFVLAVALGAAFGAAAVQGLHAQAKPKAYVVWETEVIDAAAPTPLNQAAIKAAGGRSFRTTQGRAVAIVGAAPKRVGIIEWDSLEQAQAYFNSKAYKDLAPQRDKAIMTIRLFIVEAAN